MLGQESEMMVASFPAPVAETASSGGTECILWKWRACLLWSEKAWLHAPQSFGSGRVCVTHRLCPPPPGPLVSVLKDSQRISFSCPWVNTARKGPPRHICFSAKFCPCSPLPNPKKSVSASTEDES